MKKKKEENRWGFGSKLSMLITKIVAIIVAVWLLYKLATTGGKGYDRFIGEPIEYRLPPTKIIITEKN